jgi:hypothetical protein
LFNGSRLGRLLLTAPRTDSGVNPYFETNGKGTQ